MSIKFYTESCKKKNRGRFSFAVFLIIQLMLTIEISLPHLVFAHAKSVELSDEFSQLRRILEDHGFIVKLALPPQPGSYGLLQVSTRTVWVNPVVFDLEIAVPTLVHEAVHAAQLCHGEGSHGEGSSPMPLNLGLTPYARAYRLYMRYTGVRRTLEMEAYTIQARDDRVEYVINLLNNRC